MTAAQSIGHCEWMAAPANTMSDGHVSFPVLIIVLLIAATIYKFGYLRAVMHRANADYKGVKAAVKPARKGYWTSWGKAAKVGFWVFVIFALMIAWAARDVRSDADTVPVKVTSTPTRTR